MIDYRELRIGNYVEHEDPFEIVEGIHYYDGDYRILIGNYLRPVSEIKPIRLTVEHLKVLSFEVKDDKYFPGNVFFNIQTDKYTVLEFTNNEVNGFKCYMLNPELTIKYVHQLQNLYFALTRKELMLK